jgi:hypothetical protein
MLFNTFYFLEPYMGPATLTTLECVFLVFAYAVFGWFCMRYAAKKGRTIVCNNRHCPYGKLSSSLFWLDQRCRRCVCYIGGCGRDSVDRSNLCSMHRCRRYKCHRYADGASARQYCTEHACGFVDPHGKDTTMCDIQLLPKQKFCDAHGCTQPGCNTIASRYVMVGGEYVLRCWNCTLCVFDHCENTRLPHDDVCEMHARAFLPPPPDYKDMV